MEQSHFEKGVVRKRVSESLHDRPFVEVRAELETAVKGLAAAIALLEAARPLPFPFGPL